MLGIGVMLKRLGGNGETVEAWNGSVSKVVKSVEIIDNALRFIFKDGTGLELFDGGQSCCESRYMNTDDNLSYFAGATLTDAEIKDGNGESSGEYDSCKDSQFLIITTSKGQFTVVNYNEHNGYYGGFSIEARLFSPSV